MRLTNTYRCRDEKKCVVVVFVFLVGLVFFGKYLDRTLTTTQKQRRLCGYSMAPALGLRLPTLNTTTGSRIRICWCVKGVFIRQDHNNPVPGQGRRGEGRVGLTSTFSSYSGLLSQA